MAGRTPYSDASNTLGKNSILGRLQIRVLQLGLHYLLPYALVSKLWGLVVGPFPWVKALVIEAVFHMWMTCSVLPKLYRAPLVVETSKQSVKDVLLSSLEAVAAASRLGYPIEKFFSGWFLGAEMASIPRDNLVEWTSYMMISKAPSALEASVIKDVNEVVDKMCALFGLRPPLGYDCNLRFVDNLREPLMILQRSLLQYIIASAMPRLVVAVLFRCVLGLQRSCCEETGVYYWWRAPLLKSAASIDGLPDLVFFHGLCGFTGYVPLLMTILLQSPSRGAVLIEVEDVSQCLNFERPLTPEAVVKTTRSALVRLQSQRLGPKRSCIIVGHSLGACNAAQLLEEPPAEVAGTVLIDPVAVLLALPDVAFGFLHRIPQTVFDWFCFMWCSTEPGIAYFFRRRFFWYNCIFKPDKIKNIQTLLCLSENDRLVPSKAVRPYAAYAMPHADILWWKNLDHTSFMGSVRCHVDVAQWILKCPRKNGH